MTYLSRALGKLRKDRTAPATEDWTLRKIAEGGGGSGGPVAWGDVTGKPSTFTPSAHVHPTSDVTGLDTALAGKSNTGHTHSIANVTGLQAALDGKQASGSYAAATHTHAISDTTGLQTALDGKAASSHTHTALQVTDFSEAVDDRVASLLVAGANVTLNYDDAANTLTIAAAGGGGGSSLSPALAWVL